MSKHNNAVNRRTVLTTLGIGGAALVGGVGTASARRRYGRRGFYGPTADPCGTCAPEPVCEPLCEPEPVCEPTVKYIVDICNLTCGQAWTPPALAVHSRFAKLFQVGSEACPELAALAKNADLGPMINTLGVSAEDGTDIFAFNIGDDVVMSTTDPLNTGISNKTTIEIEAPMRYSVLSMAAMMLATNDGFAGVDSIRMPRGPGEVVTAPIFAYDAGVECNSEKAADLVQEAFLFTDVVSSGTQATSEQDLTCNAEGFVHHHQGILGVCDLDVIKHGWDGPVGTITITMEAPDPCAEVDPCAVDPCAVDPCAAPDPCAVDPCADVDPCAAPDPCAVDPCADVDPCATNTCPSGLKKKQTRTMRRGYY
ncbi:spondin domain-containing protein [Haloarchaeobius sp. TZWSO28]|uniref:spondin domain-containing protein n=1 Tax=Haloarchaeobius sp. TZWSO28 TaxID=3446119 RepID=UPI003EC025E7